MRSRLALLQPVAVQESWPALSKVAYDPRWQPPSHGNQLLTLCLPNVPTQVTIIGKGNPCCFASTCMHSEQTVERGLHHPASVKSYSSLWLAAALPPQAC